MTSWIARIVYRRGLRQLERGDLDALLARFSDRCRLVFVGETPLGADLEGLPQIRRWFARFQRLLPSPRFEIQRLVVAGPLWNQTLASHVCIRSVVDGEPYQNQFGHFLTLRWGKIVEDVILEDTQKWERACRRLAAAGVEEASALPMTMAGDSATGL